MKSDLINIIAPIEEEQLFHTGDMTTWRNGWYRREDGRNTVFILRNQIVLSLSGKTISNQYMVAQDTHENWKRIQGDHRTIAVLKIQP